MKPLHGFKKIFNALIPNGILILSEKVHYENKFENQRIINTHHLFKSANGYSDLEISGKRDSLEGILKTEYEEDHILRARKVGFTRVEKILSNYSLGKLDSFKGIEEGIENTNYFLSVNKKKFILTVYEKRVKSEDLPFFSNLMSSLNKANFKCPAPIANIKNDKDEAKEQLNNITTFITAF